MRDRLAEVAEERAYGPPVAVAEACFPDARTGFPERARSTAKKRPAAMPIKVKHTEMSEAFTVLAERTGES